MGRKPHPPPEVVHERRSLLLSQKSLDFQDECDHVAERHCTRPVPSRSALSRHWRLQGELASSAKGPSGVRHRLTIGLRTNHRDDEGAIKMAILIMAGSSGTPSARSGGSFVNGVGQPGDTTADPDGPCS